mgnify:CR=1 FL=1
MSNVSKDQFKVAGRAWVFGDELNTDAMAPGLYFKEPMSVMAQHCLESVDPEFAGQVQPGDIVVAGRDFGVGSAREQAPMALLELVGADGCPGQRLYGTRLNARIDAFCDGSAALYDSECSGAARLELAEMEHELHHAAAGWRLVFPPRPSEHAAPFTRRRGWVELLTQHDLLMLRWLRFKQDGFGKASRIVDAEPDGEPPPAAEAPPEPQVEERERSAGTAAAASFFSRASWSRNVANVSRSTKMAIMIVSPVISSALAF